MKLKTSWLMMPALALALGVINACTPMNPHPMSMENAIQKAKTSADHESLAAHYLEEAASLDEKVIEHKKLAEQYNSHSYLYGKQAGALLQHCNVLIRNYEQAAEANRQMAKMHKDIAAGVAP